MDEEKRNRELVRYIRSLLLCVDELEDALFDVLTETGLIDDVTRPSWMLKLLRYQQVEVLAAVAEQQVLRLSLQKPWQRKAVFCR